MVYKDKIRDGIKGRIIITDACQQLVSTEYIERIILRAGWFIWHRSPI
jgi:hypothetical protein